MGPIRVQTSLTPNIGLQKPLVTLQKPCRDPGHHIVDRLGATWRSIIGRLMKRGPRRGAGWCMETAGTRGSSRLAGARCAVHGTPRGCIDQARGTCGSSGLAGSRWVDHGVRTWRLGACARQGARDPCSSAGHVAPYHWRTPPTALTGASHVSPGDVWCPGIRGRHQPH